MKFMKLGSKPDAFQSGGTDVRSVVSDLATDVIVHVDEVRFCLHKFPLLSKSRKLQKLVVKATEEGTDEIHIEDLPGGAKGFEICAKFCYGMVVTLSPHNVVAARCAAEYLGMTEDMDKGNLIFKIEGKGRCQAPVNLRDFWTLINLWPADDMHTCPVHQL